MKNNVADIMKKIIQECDIMLEGEVFSKEELLKAFADFLNRTITKNEHNVGIIFHTGSILYDTMMVAYAAISNLIFNESDTETIIDDIEINSLVEYGTSKRQRYIFKGHPTKEYLKRIKLNIHPELYIELEQDDGKREWVPKNFWHLIKPYRGNARSLDGKGVKKKSGKREIFFEKVLGYSKHEIPSITDTSTVIVMPKDKADLIVGGLEINFDGITIKLYELLPISFFTANEEYAYPGNPGKAEAVLKFTKKVSTARSLILKRSDNKKIGLMVLDDDAVTKGQSELPGLMKRKSLQYVYIAIQLDYSDANILLNFTEDEEYDSNPVNVFACTKDFIAAHNVSSESISKHLIQLNKQLSTVVNRKIIKTTLKGFTTISDYEAFLKELKSIKDADLDTNERNNFIIQAHSLKKLFLTAVFSMSTLDSLSEAIDIVSPKKRLEELGEYADSFPSYLKDKALKVIAYLNDSYLYLYENSAKGTYLEYHLSRNKNKHIAIIVPKSYYATILRETGIYSIMSSPDLLTIVTANRFNNKEIYDEIIAVGSFSGKKFDSFKCKSSEIIKILLFDFEKELFERKEKKADIYEVRLNKMSLIKFNNIDYNEKLAMPNITSENDTVLKSIEEMDSNIDNFVLNFDDVADINFWKAKVQSNNLNYSATVESIAVGVFETGERVFFTKMYKAYVLDDATGEVKEVKVEDLSEGDSLVFTQNNSETRDIVDVIFTKLLNSGKFDDVIVDEYKMSKQWKEELYNYMNAYNCSPKEIAHLLISKGVTVQENTIRGWLDLYSNTVGPRKSDSIKQIGVLVHNDDMAENYEKYFDACNHIRQIRRRILKQVGAAIINKLSGKTVVDDLMTDIYEKIDDIAVVLRLEKIYFTETTVSINNVNRPIHLKEL